MKKEVKAFVINTNEPSLLVNYQMRKEPVTLTDFVVGNDVGQQMLQLLVCEEGDIEEVEAPCWCYNSIKNTWSEDLVYYQGAMPHYHFIGFKKILASYPPIEGLDGLSPSFVKAFVNNSKGTFEVQYEMIDPNPWQCGCGKYNASADLSCSFCGTDKEEGEKYKNYKGIGDYKVPSNKPVILEGYLSVELKVKSEINTSANNRRFERLIDNSNKQVTDNDFEATPSSVDGIENKSKPPELELIAYTGTVEQKKTIPYGHYLVVRKDGKTHMETFNTTGWAYNDNVIRWFYFPKPTPSAQSSRDDREKNREICAYDELVPDLRTIFPVTMDELSDEIDRLCVHASPMDDIKTLTTTTGEYYNMARGMLVKGIEFAITKADYSTSLDTISQLQATNLELSKRVFELEKELDEQTLSFMDWMLLNSYEYSYINKGWQNDFPDGMDPNSEEPTYHTTQDLLQIYKQHKLK